MGIPGLFAWLRRQCPFLVRKLTPHKSLSYDYREHGGVDNFCIDMNVLFYVAVGKIYRLDIPEESRRPLNLPPKVIQKRIFEEITRLINELVYKVQPNKRIIMMVDGVAPRCKAVQQRQRRFRSASTRKEDAFDTNCLSPGTEFMDHMSKYLDHFFRKQISNSPMWRKLEVVYSSNRICGEGEHKILDWIRRHNVEGESYVFFSPDADVIMLALSIQNSLSKNPLNPPRFYILREDHHIKGEFLVMDVSAFREYLIQELTWGLDCERNQLITDFIFMCFFLGNDFLPRSPSIDLTSGGLELLFESYSSACEKENAHLILSKEGELQMNKKVFKELLYILSLNEKIIVHDNITNGEKYADPLFEKHIKTEVNPETKLEHKVFEFDQYRQEYYLRNFPRDKSIESICHSFFEGMDFVIKYYTSGVPSWNWSYPYLYSPFIQELHSHIDSYESKGFHLGKPIPAFLQLLSILPPRSKYLLPPSLSEVMVDTTLFPDKIEVDLSGKRFEWQAIIIIPPVDQSKIVELYHKRVASIDKKNLSRNYPGKEFWYKYNHQTCYEFKSYYGVFNCFADVKME